MTVVWVGGGTGAGKTTAARVLAARFGLRAFHVDARWYAYDARLDDHELSAEEQWLGQTPAQQAAQFEATSRRRMALVLEDLAALPDLPAIVVEGPQVVPDLVPRGDAAVFLLPAPEFQRRILETRAMPKTSDPVRALANRIEKDRLFAQRLQGLAAPRDVVEVDGSRGPDAVAQLVAERLAPVLPPPGGDLAEARRWENDAVAANLRAWMQARQCPDEPVVMYPFACECGRFGCAERVELSVVARGARVAAAHA